MAEAMIGLVIYAFVAFYSGEKPPKEETLTDVKAWNKKHGYSDYSYDLVSSSVV